MKVSNKFKAVTSTELFKQQVRNTIEFARAEGTDNIPLPLQYGGLFGQRTTLSEDIVVSVTRVDGSV